MNTKHPAFNFFVEKWNDEKHIIHCNAVIEVCLQAIQNTDLNTDIFLIAGWIHDMGKLIDKEEHHIKSLIYLKEFFELNPSYLYLNEIVTDCIINHRTHTTPKTIEGELFKIADKIALHRLEWLEYKKNK